MKTMKKVVLAISIVAIAMLVSCGTSTTTVVKKDTLNVKTDTVKLDTVKVQPVKK